MNEWYLIGVLTCISLMTNEIDHQVMFIGYLDSLSSDVPAQS